MCLFKSIIVLVSKNLLAVNVLTSLKNSSDLHKSTFILLSGILREIELEKVILIRTEILGLLVNTLTANYEFSRSNTDHLPLPIQIKLSKKP